MYFKPNKNSIPLYLVLAFLGIVFIFSIGFFLLTSPNDFNIFLKDNTIESDSAKDSYKYLSNNEKGDFFGGITNPLIAFIGVIVTGLAFYMQYKANQIVLQQISMQKKTDEITRFETKFYELLRYHKENVRNLEYRFKDENVDIDLNGKSVIDSFINEVNNLKTTLDSLSNFGNQSHVERFKSSYYFMFYGINNPNINNVFDRLINFTIPDDVYYVLDELIVYGSNENRFLKYDLPLGEIYDPINDTFIETTSSRFHESVLHFSKNGYINEISLYLRNLFYLVNFVSKNMFLTYENKREYIRIIRAQLSANEQILIYYNWLSGIGNEWESKNHQNRPFDKENYFLTNYRIIHNINPINVIQNEGITLETVFTDEFCNFLTESDKINDEYLFDNNLIKKVN